MDNQEIAKQLQDITNLLTEKMIPAINNLTQEKASYVDKNDFNKMLEIVKQVQEKQQVLEKAVMETREALSLNNEMSSVALTLSETILSNNTPDIKLKTVNDLIKSRVEADSVEIVFNNDEMMNSKDLSLYNNYFNMASTSDKPIISPDNKVAIVPYCKETAENPIAFAVLKSDNVDNSPFDKISEIADNTQLGKTLASAINNIHNEVTNDELLKLNRQLNQRLCYDGLTEVARTKNDGLRDYVDKNIEPIFQDAIKGRDVPCVLVGYADFNNFADVNNLYGHDAGDAAIKHLANVINDELRRDDALIRMGGDEFVVIVTAPTVEDGLKVFDRIKDKVSETPISITADFSKENNVNDKEELEIIRSISMGVTYMDKDKMQVLLASCQGNEENDAENRFKIIQSKIQEADGLMYASKDAYHKYAPKINDSQENEWKENLGNRVAASKIEQIIETQIKTSPLNIAVPDDVKNVIDSINEAKANDTKVFSLAIDKSYGKAIINPYLANENTSVARMEMTKNDISLNLALVVEGKATIAFDGVEYSTTAPDKYPPELVDTILNEGVSNLQIIPEKDAELPHVTAYYDFTSKDGEKANLMSEPYTGSIQYVERALETHIKEYANVKMDDYIKEHNLEKDNKNKDVKTHNNEER